MNFEGVLHLVYWDNPMYRVDIQDRETVGSKEEELVLEFSFFHNYFDRQMHFKFSLASGNMYYQGVNGNWAPQEPDHMKVTQLIDCDDSFLLACEGLLTIDVTPHLVHLDRSKHFIRADDQRLNVIIDRKTGLQERIKDLNNRFWNLEVGKMQK